MSLSIFEHGDGRYRLVRDEREIGWVEGRTLCFRGYADTDAAAEAATTAYGALIRWAARQLRTGPVPHRRRRLSVRRDGLAEWLTLGRTRVARLRRFGPDDLTATEPEVGFEIDLPTGIVGAVALGAAQALDRAIQAHAAAATPSTARRATTRASRPLADDGASRPRTGRAPHRVGERVVERGVDRRPAAPAPSPRHALHLVRAVGPADQHRPDRGE